MISLIQVTVQQSNDRQEGGSTILTIKAKYTAQLGHNAKSLILKASQTDDEGNTMTASSSTLLRYAYLSLIRFKL